MGTYIASNAPFVLVDLTGRPAWLKKYKIQDEMNEPVRQASTVDCVCWQSRKLHPAVLCM